MINFDEINPKERKMERTLVLRPIDGKNVLKSTGMVDNRLFTGDNNLVLVKDPVTNFWTFKYLHGIVQPALSGKFTSFAKALEHGRTYFKTRGVQIAEVLD